MKRRLVPLLGVAFVVAVISTGVFYGLIVGKMRTSSGQPRPIVVAAGSLPRGTVLDKTHVKLMPLSGRAVPEGAFTDPDQVTGLTVLQNIEPDQPITQASLSSRDSAAPSAQAIPEGLRAVSIRVTDSPGVVAMLHAGYKVDVQAVRSRGSGETELHTVLQDVEVLTVQPESAQNRSGPGAVITLLAKPEDADAEPSIPGSVPPSSWLRFVPGAAGCAAGENSGCIPEGGGSRRAGSGRGRCPGPASCPDRRGFAQRRRRAPLAAGSPGAPGFAASMRFPARLESGKRGGEPARKTADRGPLGLHSPRWQ